VSRLRFQTEEVAVLIEEAASNARPRHTGSDTMNLTGKVALITGGTAGIREATVHRISRTGAKVVFVGRDEENGRLIESELKGEGRDAFFLRADLSVPEEVRQVVPDAVRVFGRLD
jgi:NAD(P)-dependent dehydrogenase (short-subunit alcohol dehydrogenase family)